MEEPIEVFSATSDLEGLITSPLPDCDGEVIRYQGENYCFVKAQSRQFDKYACVTVDDYIAIWDYISRLNRACKEWRE